MNFHFVFLILCIINSKFFETLSRLDQVESSFEASWTIFCLLLGVNLNIFKSFPTLIELADLQVSIL